MSMYGVFMNERFAVIAADTKKTTKKDGKVILQQADFQKLHLFNDLAVAFGGYSNIVQLVLLNLSAFPKEEITIYTINDIVQNIIKPNKDKFSRGHNGSEYMLEILAIQYDKTLQKNVMYSISSCDNFQLEKTIYSDGPNSNSYSWGGYEPEKYANSFAEYCKKYKPNNLTEVFLNNFQMNVNERVGGFMDIIGFDNGKLVEYDRFKLKDKYLETADTDNPDNEGHAVIAGHIHTGKDTIVGKNVVVGENTASGRIDFAGMINQAEGSIEVVDHEMTISADFVKIKTAAHGAFIVNDVDILQAIRDLQQAVSK